MRRIGYRHGEQDIGNRWDWFSKKHWRTVRYL